MDLWLELIIGAVGLMIAGYVWRRQALCIAASGLWLLFGVYAYTQSTGTFDSMDVEYGAFLIGMGMMMMCASQAMFMRDPINEEEQKEFEESPLPYDVEENIKRMVATREMMNRYKAANPSRRNKAKEKRRYKRESKRYKQE